MLPGSTPPGEAGSQPEEAGLSQLSNNDSQRGDRQSEGGSGLASSAVKLIRRLRSGGSSRQSLDDAATRQVAEPVRVDRNDGIRWRSQRRGADGIRRRVPDDTESRTYERERKVVTPAGPTRLIEPDPVLTTRIHGDATPSNVTPIQEVDRIFEGAGDNVDWDRVAAARDEDHLQTSLDSVPEPVRGTQRAGDEQPLDDRPPSERPTEPSSPTFGGLAHLEQGASVETTTPTLSDASGDTRPNSPFNWPDDGEPPDDMVIPPGYTPTQSGGQERDHDSVVQPLPGSEDPDGTSRRGQRLRLPRFRRDSGDPTVEHIPGTDMDYIENDDGFIAENNAMPASIPTSRTSRDEELTAPATPLDITSQREREEAGNANSVDPEGNTFTVSESGGPDGSLRPVGTFDVSHGGRESMTPLGHIADVDSRGNGSEDARGGGGRSVEDSSIKTDQDLKLMAIRILLEKQGYTPSQISSAMQQVRSRASGFDTSAGDSYEDWLGRAIANGANRLGVEENDLIQEAEDRIQVRRRQTVDQQAMVDALREDVKSGQNLDIPTIEREGFPDSFQGRQSMSAGEMDAAGYPEAADKLRDKYEEELRKPIDLSAEDDKVRQDIINKARLVFRLEYGAGEDADLIMRAPIESINNAKNPIEVAREVLEPLGVHVNTANGAIVYIPETGQDIDSREENLDNQEDIPFSERSEEERRRRYLQIYQEVLGGEGPGEANYDALSAMSGDDVENILGRRVREVLRENHNLEIAGDGSLRRIEQSEEQQEGQPSEEDLEALQGRELSVAMRERRSNLNSDAGNLFGRMVLAAMNEGQAITPALLDTIEEDARYAANIQSLEVDAQRGPVVEFEPDNQTVVRDSLGRRRQTPGSSPIPRVPDALAA